MTGIRLSDIQNLSPERRALLEALLKDQQIDLNHNLILPQERNAGTFPLSFSQQRLWFLDQLEPGSPLYNIPMAQRLIGVLDVETLTRSLNEVIRRHESLRTVFDEGEDGPVQVIIPELPLTIGVFDLQNMPERERESEVRRLAMEEAQEPFDLRTGPLLRASLLRLSPQEHVLLLTMHHIISDGWSMGVLVKEVSLLYDAFSRNRLSPLPDLPVQYVDYARWQRNWLKGKVQSEQLAYWKTKLKDLPPVIDLPTDYVRAPVLSPEGDSYSFSLPGELTEGIKKLANDADVTLFMVLLATFHLLLYRYTGQEDIPIGTPIANRNRREIEDLIGFFVNTLVMRVPLSGDFSFRAFLQTVRQTTMEAYAHQDLPFEMLVEALQPERNMSHTPLFQVMFVLQNVPVQAVAVPGMTITPLEIHSGTATFDMTLLMSDSPNGLAGTVEYNTSLFKRSTIQRMMRHLHIILEGIVANPDRLISHIPVLAEGERQQLLVTWNDTAAVYPDKFCVHEPFEVQALQHPDAIAARFKGATLSYQELDRWANQVAHYLRNLGVGPEVLVGLCVERSFDMLVGLLGILKAGGAYFPLDPQYPQDRLAYMLEDSGVQILVTQSHLKELLPVPDIQTVCLDIDSAGIAEQSQERVTSGVRPENIAYVIYTSGSTGKPKGVMVPHRAIVNHNSAVAQMFKLTRSDRVLQFSTINFDAAVEEIFPTLGRGATLVLAPSPGGLMGIEELERLITQEAVTILDLPTAYWHEWAANLGTRESYPLATTNPAFSLSPSVRLVAVGGDKASTERYAQWHKQVGDNVVWINTYGPTETTVIATSYPDTEIINRDTSSKIEIPIGRPISNVQIYILDPQLQPVPVGVPGELWIGGLGLARGYFKYPALTSERFVPDPFSPKAGSRMYRSGDIARYLPDGNLEFLGRVDHQVKIRGFRVELNEIEVLLKQHPAIEDSLVVAHSATGRSYGEVGDSSAEHKQLVAYIIPQGQTTIDTVELLDYLKQHLPDYMLPVAFVTLDVFPLMPSGKLDRKALPIPALTCSQLPQPYMAPRTPVEDVVAGLWSQVLRVEQVGIYDNFFDMGGHSLLATRLASQVRAAFNVELPLRIIFEDPTLAGVASYIERQLFIQAAQSYEPIEPVSRDGELPLSFAQQRMWFLNQLEPDSPLYNIPDAVRIQGPLDIGLLQHCLNKIILRHEVLRTTFPTISGKPYLNIESDIPVDIEVVDLTVLPKEDREAAAQHCGQIETQHIFDLANGPLWRVVLCILDVTDYILFLTMHHIISDGWSMGVLVHEIANLYTGQPLPGLPIQYTDFAHWQREWLQSEILESQIAYWREQLAGPDNSMLDSRLNLPTDRSRPAMQTSNGDFYRFDLSPELTQQLNALSRRMGVTLFMTLLAAFQTLLYRYSGQESISVGTPIANRNRTEVEGLIGFFVNTLVLRTDLSGNPSFELLLRRVRDVTLGAYTHQDVPFELLVSTLQPERNLGQTPFFQVMFMLQNAPMESFELPGMSLSPLPVESNLAMFDLTLAMEETPAGLVGAFEYNTDLFDADTIQRLVGHFNQLLQELVTNPQEKISQVSLLTSEEQHMLLETWNTTQTPYPHNLCVHQLFEEQARAYPQAIVAQQDGEVLTYGELNLLADQLAHHLRRIGVGPDVVVGLCVARSFEMLVGLLGILKAGGAYLPIDPEYPATRLRFMLEDSGVGIIVTQSYLKNLLPDAELDKPNLRFICLDTEWDQIAGGCDTIPVLSGVTPANLAYVIYTSGSTGQPKGVMVEHRSVVNHNTAVAKLFGLTAEDRILQFATISFDASVEEIFPILWRGGSLVLLPKGEIPTGEVLDQLIAQTSITVLDFPTAYWHTWVSSLVSRGVSPPPSLRLVAVGGEKASIDSYLKWHKIVGERVTLWNTYGPTEGTIIVSAYQGTGTGLWDVPIGRPIDNVRLYILDDQMQPVPVGVPGELWIGGAALARGYLNRPELTAERFVPDPFVEDTEARIYKTGDIVRYLPDGNIAFIGRRDHQVKIRGFRVELGEVESALRRHPRVQDSVVVVQDDATHKRLVTYIVPTEGTLTVSELREFLAHSLPGYMLPSAFVMLSEWPLTVQGKVDRNALPAPGRERPELERAYIAPRTPVEETLAEIWASILGITHVGIEDNFFELGGDSILSIQVIARANQAGLRLTPKQLFEYPTIAGLALVAEEGAVISAEQGIVEGFAPLTPIQHWFFEQEFHNPHHWKQTVLLEVKQHLDHALLRLTVAYLLSHHDALRLRFKRSEDGWQQFNAGVEDDVPFIALDLSEFSDLDLDNAIRTGAVWLRTVMNFINGPLLRVAYFDLGPERPGRLLLTVHHLAIDGVSWRILLEDFQLIYHQLLSDEDIVLPLKTTSYKHWAGKLLEYTRTAAVRQELDYWLAVGKSFTPSLPLDFQDGENTVASTQEIVVSLSQEETKLLLSEVPAVYHTEINDVLLAALARAVINWTGTPSVWLTLEGHGREPLFDDVDLSRTVGWFTVLYPVHLDLLGVNGVEETLIAVKEQLRQVPNHGIGYGLLRYFNTSLDGEHQLREQPYPEICFNYLGQFDALLQDKAYSAMFGVASESIGPDRSPLGQRSCVLEINGGIISGCLELTWSYSANLHRHATIARLAQDYITALREIIDYCQNPDAGGYTPSDFPMANLNQRQLNKILSKLD